MVRFDRARRQVEADHQRSGPSTTRL